MKCLFLIQGQDVPSSRYRVLQFLPFWKAAGHQAQVLEWREALEGWKRTLDLARECSVVFLHRKRLSPKKISELKSCGSRVVYDIDDAVMFRDALKPGRSASFLRMWRYNHATAAVDQVIAGNSYIARNTRKARNLAVLPTLIDLSRYPMPPVARAPSAPTLVWIGDGGSLHYLEKLIPVLDEVALRVPGVRLKVICNRFPRLEKMPVDEVPWNADTEAQELATSSVGLMPLGMDPWSQGKCSLKFLQYLAVGIPAVVTPAGLNADILSKADCGRAALTPGEWIKHLTELLSPGPLAAQLGAAGRSLVEKEFSLKARASEWVRLVSGPSHSSMVRSPKE